MVDNKVLTWAPLIIFYVKGRIILVVLSALYSIEQYLGHNGHLKIWEKGKRKFLVSQNIAVNL